MNIRSAIGLTVSLAALQLAAAATAQDAAEISDDPRPVFLQSSGSLLFMMMNNLPADSFRKDLDAYNAKFPAPAKKEIAAAIHKGESTKSQQAGTCVAKLPTKLKVTSSTAAPAVRQYIADKEITNAWIVSHTPKGCGKKPARVYTVAQKMDGELLTILMGDGETLINLNIHYDLSRILGENLLKFYASKKVDCDGQFISAPNMRIVSKSDEWSKPFYGTYTAGKWREEWTFKGCGGTAVIPIDMQWLGATNTEYLVQFPEATFTPDS